MSDFKPRNTSQARVLRNEAPPAERELWKYINRRQIAGAKFSRQMPIGPYFCDFLCRELQLIVELDGFSHDLRVAHDAARNGYLARLGFHVLRFTNEDVFSNMDGVVARVEMTVIELRNLRHENSPTPSPSREREGNVGISKQIP